MQALVPEPTRRLARRAIAIEEPLGPRAARIALRTIGSCGSGRHDARPLITASVAAFDFAAAMPPPRSRCRSRRDEAHPVGAFN